MIQKNKRFGDIVLIITVHQSRLFFSLLNTKIAIGGNVKRSKIPFYFFSNIPKNRVGGSVNQFLKKKALQ
jgi:hypothetical protein